MLSPAERQKRYRERYPEKVREARLAYEQTESYKQSVKRTYLKHRESKIEYARTYYQAHREQNQEKNRARARRHYENYRLRRNEIREEWAIAYGGKCTCCGETRLDFLTVEHSDHKPHRHPCGRRKGGLELLLLLKRQGWPKENLTILCYKCNMATRWGHKCPHKEEM